VTGISIFNEMAKIGLCQGKSVLQELLCGHSSSVRVKHLAQNFLDQGRADIFWISQRFRAIQKLRYAYDILGLSFSLTLPEK